LVAGHAVQGHFFADVFFLLDGFTAMTSPGVLSRLVLPLAPPTFVFTWLRFRAAVTAPFRAMSPTGL
jgi:hypothetical protein